MLLLLRPLEETAHLSGRTCRIHSGHSLPMGASGKPHRSASVRPTSPRDRSLPLEPGPGPRGVTVPSTFQRLRAADEPVRLPVHQTTDVGTAPHPAATPALFKSSRKLTPRSLRPGRCSETERLTCRDEHLLQVRPPYTIRLLLLLLPLLFHPQ